MIKCPVCQSSQLGRPEVCNVCKTPLRRTIYRSRSIGERLTLLIPGLGHYLRGYFLRGSLALFGSLFGLLYLFVGSYDYTEFARRIVVWGLFWLIWLNLWRWDFSNLSRRVPSAGRVLSYLLAGLILSNVLMAIIIGVMFGQRFQF